MRIHRHRQRTPKYQIPQYDSNDKIKSAQLRVIDENGAPLGILDTAEATRLAKERELDLVVVSPKAEPPVAKFINYGQFKYQKEKEMRKQRAQSKEVETKGVRLSLRIGEHDLNIRFDQAKKFLERGDKVRAEIVLRGREKAHAYLAREIIENFVKRLQAEMPLRVEQSVTKQANQMSAIVCKA